MKKLKFYMNVFFSSYTISSLMVALFILHDSPVIGVEWIFQMALLSFAITILMFITDIISEKFFGNVPVFVYILFGLVEVTFCVFLMGGLWYQWFPFNIEWLLETVIICIVIYFTVFGIIFFQEKKSAENINKIIKNRRNNNGKDN